MENFKWSLGGTIRVNVAFSNNDDSLGLSFYFFNFIPEMIFGCQRFHEFRKAEIEKKS